MTKIALIDGDTVLRTWRTASGVAPVRADLPDGSQVSPVVLGWSSGSYAVVDVVEFEVPEGKRIIAGPSYAIEDGQAVETYEVEDIPIVVPDRVSARQFRLQLLADELLDLVEGWIATQERDVQVAYASSGTFVRDEPMMQAGFGAMGFTPEQIDAFFLAASAL